MSNSSFFLSPLWYKRVPAIGPDLTRLCFGLARAIDGRALEPGPLPVPALLDCDDDATTLALETLLDGCVEETVAAAVAVEAARTEQQPAVRRVLQVIARDEQRHSELAFRTLAWALQRGGPQLVAAVAAQTYRLRVNHSRQQVARQQQAGASGQAVAVAVLGRLGASGEMALRAATLEQVVVPCLETLLRRHQTTATAAEPAVIRC